MTQQTGAPQPAPGTQTPWWRSKPMVTAVWLPLFHAPMVAAVAWPAAPMWLRAVAATFLGANYNVARKAVKRPANS